MSQVTPFPPEGVDTGATNTALGHSETVPSGNDGSGRLRAEVARALGNAGVSPFEIEDFRIEDVADRLHRVGFRLVSEDEATVERVARRIAEEALGRYTGDPAGLDWESMGDEDQNDFKLVARAAVRALREAPSATSKPAQRQHDCCPHCTNRTGSCVRCGVRDAAEGEQLCEPCDREVEAEVTGRALREAGQ